MDFGDVFRIIGRFFLDFCGVNVTFFGVSFTVGTLFLWCAVAVILINFVRGLMS